jgi:hypothetical protein
MTPSLIDRLIGAARSELARGLDGFCREIGAAESSILFPAGGGELTFFASNNPELMKPGAPRVPINASFSGIAFRTGQTVAVADAAGQKQHFGAVDSVTKARTREFAAIPIVEREVLGVLTLVNRASPGAAAAPFSLVELRRGEAFAREAAAALRRLPGLRDADPGAPGDDLADQLSRLNEAERRVARALVGALIENRVP